MLIKISSGPRQNLDDLVDLLTECHDRIRRFLALAHDVGIRFEPSDEAIVDACVRIERYFTEALPLHVADEEESIVPRLRGREDAVDRALQIMEEEHSRHAPKLDMLCHATAALRQLPRDPTLKNALADAAAELEREFADHLALEESIIFPAIRRLLAKDVQVNIVEELRQRRKHRDP